MKKIVLSGVTICLLIALAVVMMQSKDQNARNTASGSGEKTRSAVKPQYAATEASPSLAQQPHPPKKGVCDDFEQLNKQLAITHGHMLTAEDNLYKSLEQAPISIEGKNAIYHAAGFPVSNFRTKRIGFAANNLSRFTFSARPQPVMPPQSYQLILALAKAEYADIIQMLENGDLTQDSTFGGQNILSTLMMHTQLTPATLRQILSTGFKVTLTDLVFATLTKQDQFMLDALAQAYAGDVDTAFQANGKTYNLTTLSAEALNYPALKLWSSLNVSHDVKSDLYSSLDILPVPTNEEEYEQAIAILDFLVKNDVQANYPYTMSRINQWTNHQYQDLFQLSDRFEQLNSDGRISEDNIRYLERMRQLQSHYYSLLDTLLAQQTDCGTVDTAQYSLPGDNEHKSMRDWLASLPKMDQLSDEDIFSIHMSIATKKAVDAGDTNSVIALMEQYGSLGGAHPEFDQVLFLNMLFHNAHTEQLIQLTQYTPVPEHAVFMLIAQQRIEDIPKLTPYGLNIEATDHLGQSPIEFARQIGFDADKIKHLSVVLQLDTY